MARSMGPWTRISIAAALCLAVAPSATATEYFVSASSGRDGHDGQSPRTAWASLERVQAADLEPGDVVRFERGDTWRGQLVIDESGLEGAPIHFTSYGEGELPVIDGASTPQGSALAAILIRDQDHLELSHLAVRNFRRQPMEGEPDVDAYGILVENTGLRSLRGFEFHHLDVAEIYPIRARRAFNETSVTGIRFETRPAQSRRRAFNTGDIFLYDNRIRHTARFGIAIRHRRSRQAGVTDTSLDYDVDVRIAGNRCEDLGGSCVLMNGVFRGLLEKNAFMRSGALVEPALSVNRGSGAWFFRSRHVVAQHNVAVSSRGHNDSSGIHVDYGNRDVLVQYNFFVDNEGYGTEILGKNENVIWRHNISVGDGTRRTGVERPEGGRSQHRGKTIFVSDFAVPDRIQSREVFIYNNTYFVVAGSDPFFELNAEDVHVWNNAFIVEEGGRLGKKLNVGWLRGRGVDIRGNVYSGNVSPSLIRLDTQPSTEALFVEGNSDDAEHHPTEYALDGDAIRAVAAGIEIEHPAFPLAGEGIFEHVDPEPVVDYFDNVLGDGPTIGAGERPGLASSLGPN